MSSEFNVGHSRSPRYPRYSLEAAIGYARRLYDGAHRSLVETNVAYKVMGFAGKSGASATALGSVRQFGMIEAPRGGLRISSLGLQILEPSGRDEYVEALHVAANQPTAFAQLSTHFDGDFPRSDEPIRAYLIRQLGFSKKGADECIASLRETFSFLESQLADRQDSEAPNESLTRIVGASGHARGNSTGTAVAEAAPQAAALAATDLIVVPLTKDCRVEMRFFGDVSGRALSKLTRYVELLKEDWTEE